LKPNVGIIGRGNVGSALKRGLDKAGYQTKMVGNESKAVAETAKWADVIILAVPMTAFDEVLMSMGEGANGKTLVDVTNVITPEARAALGTRSSAEELQKKASRSKVVKSFNHVFAENMDSGHLKGEQLTVFVAGSDSDAKAQTLQLAKDIGFNSVDAGPLENARYLESLGNLIIDLGYGRGMGVQIGYDLIK
jgi:8-hydroxy-5-deazaflavin:NADPH oxidoreductase